MTSMNQIDPVVLVSIEFRLAQPQFGTLPGIGKALLREVTYPGSYEFAVDNWWDCRGNGIGYVARAESSDCWMSSWCGGAYNRRYGLDQPMTLEVALRWIYLHNTYRDVRFMHSLQSFASVIMQLIEAHEGMHSQLTYNKLCGFTPIQNPEWKLYLQSDPFELLFHGPREGVVQAISEIRDKNLLLLNPDNHLVEVWTASRHFLRYKGGRSKFPS